jgi:8-oxo-dGTP diphosphatase
VRDGAGPAVGVGGVVIDKGRVLLIRRGKQPLRGRWVVPGGTVELGETLEQAVVRELREETGLEVRPGELVTVFDRIAREGGVVRYHYVIADFVCHVIGGTLRAGDDALDAVFASPEELDGYALPPKALDVVLDGFRRAGVGLPCPLPSPGPEA